MTKGYISALRELAGLVGDETMVSDGADDWRLWCLIDSAVDGAITQGIDDTPNDYAVSDDGIRLVRPDGYIDNIRIVRVLNGRDLISIHTQE